jgi:hypothetical protein
VGHGAGLDDIEEGKLLTLQGAATPTPRSSIQQPVALPTTIQLLCFVKQTTNKMNYFTHMYEGVFFRFLN